MTTRKLMMAVGALAGLGFAMPAHAWVQFCNGTSATIWTAYSWRQTSCATGWAKRGWWSLSPGQCKIVYGPAISNRYSYYYGEGGGRTWSGPYYTCTPYAAFNLCDHQCFSPSRNLGYRQLDTGSYTNYTLTLRP